MENLSYLKSVNAAYIDELYELYLQNPDSTDNIDPSWKYFFDGLGVGQTEGGSSPEAAAVPTGPAAKDNAALRSEFKAEAQVAELILAYRQQGRILANINPLSAPPTSHPALELSHYGLSNADLAKSFAAGHMVGLGLAPLSEIIKLLKDTYCGPIAVEFMHIQEVNEREWLQKKMESSRNREVLDAATKKTVLRRLTESESFERFLHTRYVAQKRFSIEGAEAMIPAMDRIIDVGAELGAEEFVLGMAHRGRLNVLTQLFGKKTEYIFTEFEGAYKPDISKGEGDVKYHMGFSADVTAKNGKKVHLSMASNPSHLEFVGSVIEGMTRAKQSAMKDTDRAKVVPITIHGDASFAGQGVCYENLNLSQLPGYKTGGTLHIVVNNQIGFTTSPKDSRSTPYSTDLAKMLETPIFHVNGDEPEALYWTAKLCMEYRQKFKKDVFIDLVCYRKLGHNEGDEPAFTQPLLYKKIKTHPSTRELYAAKLTQTNVVTGADAEAMVQTAITALTEAQTRTKANPPQPYVSAYEGIWKDFHRATEQEMMTQIKTSVPEKTLKELAQSLNHFPADFKPHPKLTRLFETRFQAVEQDKGIDWGNAETLAYASLVTEGYGVRLSGQDAERGTFSHRHAVLHDFETDKEYLPLNHIREGQKTFEVCNSHLSEVAVLGFEYGHSLSEPRTLTIWEAQFGDFANGAQVIIDQFLAATESKWQRSSGLTMLLPHGYEGQGSEHSSARLERFLQLCGRQNMFVCNLSTPAQIFHALRRQVLRDFRKPLVVMSPKTLLRHPMAVSPLKDFTDNGFEEVLDDPAFNTAALANRVKKVIICSGKIYYDLVTKLTAKKIGTIAVVRVEQLYPWPAEKLAKILAKYPKATLMWVQEEPRNMGAWSYVFNTWSGGYSLFQNQVDGRTIQYEGRDIGAAPAVGSHKLHEIEQESLIEKAIHNET